MTLLKYLSLPYFFLFLGLINLWAVLVCAYDKAAAKAGKWRVKERTLWFISLIGGSLGMLVTMSLIRHKTKHRSFMIGLPILLVLQVLLLLWAFDSRLTVTRYRLPSPKINSSVRLAVITDLHSCDYGTKQIQIVKALKQANPDLILLVGDIFDDQLPDNKTRELLDGIADKYPCYYVAGNHEFWSGNVDKYKKLLGNYGVEVLAGDYLDVKVRDESLRIYGIDDPDTDYYSNLSLSYHRQ